MNSFETFGGGPIVLVIYVFIFGIFGWVIGQRKGRAGAGFFFGVLLGPLGWLIVLLGPDVKVAQESARLRKCPYCAELVQPDARLCKHCGKDIAETLVSDEEKFERWRKSRDANLQMPAQPAPQKVVAALSIPCPLCSQQLKVETVQPGENWCPHCCEKFNAE